MAGLNTMIGSKPEEAIAGLKRLRSFRELVRPFTTTAKAAASRFVTARRYLARNVPFLWQIRAHLLVFGFLLFAFVSVLVGLLLPVRRGYIPSVSSIHLLLFLIATLFVCYWLFSYFRVLDPRLTPPILGDPPIIALMIGAVIIVLPTYAFLPVAQYRIIRHFPDIHQEAQIHAFFATLASSAGDTDGPFGPIGSKLPPMSPYRVEANGRIGPVDEANKRTLLFQRKVVCTVGQELFAEMARTLKFTLSQPVAPLDSSSISGVLTLFAGNPPSGSSASFSPLYHGYSASGAFKYTFSGPQSGTANYCLSIPKGFGCQPPMFAVKLDCDGISAAEVGSIFANIQSVAHEFSGFGNAVDGAKALRAAFQPFCDVGMTSAECLAAYTQAMQSKKLLHVMSPKNDLENLYEANQTYQEFHLARSITLHNPSEHPQQEIAFPTIAETKQTGLWTVSGSWTVFWLFAFGLMSIFVKSFRLIGENSTNYLFLTLFLVPGISLGSLLGADYVAAAIAITASVLGIDLKIEFDGNMILLGLVALSAAYVSWQAFRKRASGFARKLGAFLLFCLVTFSLLSPWISVPFVGTIAELEYLPMSLAYVVYFGVIYEVCYYLVRTVDQKPH